tara:strand:- start:346 stop:1596 length:1251 start_codon:yes stop_codon:yes gene_type:complete
MGLTKPLVQAASTGIETVFKKFGSQLTDAGKNTAKLMSNKTDIFNATKLVGEESRLFIDAANSGNSIQMMNVLENANRTQLSNRRSAQSLQATSVPTVTYKKGGSLEAPRKAIQDFVEADPTRKEKLLSGEIKRGSIANIVDDAGDVKDIQGMTKFLTTNNANFLTFPSRTKRNASKGVRLNLMKVPEPELRKFAAAEFPDNPELIEEYLKTYAKGFGAVQEAARRNGLSIKQLSDELVSGKLTPRHKKFLTQYDAGHWFSTRYKLDQVTDPLERTPTTGRSARLEPRTQNIQGGAKLEHETNPHLAEMVGIPRTWKEDFLLFADSKLNTKGLPQWEEILGTEGMRLVEELPHDASKAEAKAVFKQIMEMVNKQGEAAKDIARDFSDYKRSPDIEIDADNTAKQQWLRDELAKYED